MDQRKSTIDVRIVFSDGRIQRANVDILEELHTPQSYDDLVHLKAVLSRVAKKVIFRTLAAFGSQVTTEEDRANGNLLTKDDDTAMRAIAYLVLNDVVNHRAYWPQEIADWATELMRGEKRTGGQLVREATGITNE